MNHMNHMNRNRNNRDNQIEIKLKYDPSPVEAQDRGAGFILFSVDRDKCIHFLMSRERKWLCSSNYNTTRYAFSGFEGRSYPNEKPMETASRELVEESLGVVPGLGTQSSAMDSLCGNDYFRKICMIVQTESGVLHRFTTFVKQIEFNPNLPKRYAMVRRSLHYIKTISKIKDPKRKSEESKKFFHDHPQLIDFAGLYKVTDDVGEITGVGVKSDYMEKDSIIYMTEREVKQSLNQDKEDEDSTRHKDHQWDISTSAHPPQQSQQYKIHPAERRGRNVYTIKPYIRPALKVALREIRMYMDGGGGDCPANHTEKMHMHP